MYIEIDRKAIFGGEQKIATIPGSRTDEKGEIAGWSKGNEVVVTADKPLNIVATLCHEVGHFAGRRRSFTEKRFLSKKTKNILTFDEIKDGKISLELNPQGQEKVKEILSNKRRSKPNNDHLWLAGMLLNVVFRGNLKAKEIKFYAFTRGQMRRSMAKNPPMGTVKSGDEVVTVNTKNGRNVELSSYYIQFACVLVLENTVKKYGLMDDNFEQFFAYAGDLPDHQRAQNIIARAYAGRGWRIPSELDLARKRDRV